VASISALYRPCNERSRDPPEGGQAHKDDRFRWREAEQLGHDGDQVDADGALSTWCAWSVVLISGVFALPRTISLVYQCIAIHEYK
jgi:hypothetical protein